MAKCEASLGSSDRNACELENFVQGEECPGAGMYTGKNQGSYQPIREADDLRLNSNFKWFQLNLGETLMGQADETVCHVAEKKGVLMVNHVVLETEKTDLEVGAGWPDGLDMKENKVIRTREDEALAMMVNKCARAGQRGCVNEDWKEAGMEFLSVDRVLK